MHIAFVTVLPRFFLKFRIVSLNSNTLALYIIMRSRTIYRIVFCVWNCKRWGERNNNPSL